MKKNTKNMGSGSGSGPGQPTLSKTTPRFEIMKPQDKKLALMLTAYRITYELNQLEKTSQIQK